MRELLDAQVEFVQRAFEGEGALNAAILLNALMLFGFLLRFYRRQIGPIRSQAPQAVYWKNAWNFITVAILFLIFGALIDVVKFADVEMFYGADLVASLLDVGFLALLAAGIHMVKKRFA